MTSQERVVRQPPQYGGFEDTQEELDWYGSNPEGINRHRPLPEVLGRRYGFAAGEESPSPPFNTLPTSYHPPIKRKASISLDEQKEPRKGTKRSKLAPVIPSEVASIMLKLPVDTPSTVDWEDDVRERISV